MKYWQNIIYVDLDHPFNSLIDIQGDGRLFWETLYEDIKTSITYSPPLKSKLYFAKDFAASTSQTDILIIYAIQFLSRKQEKIYRSLLPIL